MKIYLKPALSKTEFLNVKTYKNIIDEKSTLMKIAKLNSLDIEFTAELKNRISTYMSYIYLPLRDFITVNDHNGVRYVNDLLVSRNCMSMSVNEAYEILQADEEFAHDFMLYISNSVTKKIDELLQELIDEVVEGKAFCDKDYDKNFDEYSSSINILANDMNKYFIKEE